MTPAKRTEPKPCLFCAIRDGDTEAAIVYEDENTLAFLDHSPLFFGHVLVIPREHHQTLMTIPAEKIPTLFAVVQRVSLAVQQAMDSHGIFIAANNGVSQSVDHLHVHVVPRNRKDGLRGFMWPRHKYADGQATEVASKIRDAIASAR